MFLRVQNAFCFTGRKAQFPSDLLRVSSLISVPGKLFLRVVEIFVVWMVFSG